MNVPDYRRSHFDSGEEDPMGPLANMTDIMLVFAVGLMVALAASEQRNNNGDTSEPGENTGVAIEAGRELPEMPSGANEAGSGYEAVGRVYRDPETDQLILIDE